MLLCVAGGGSTGFNRDRSREGARCNAQSIFSKNNTNSQIVEERCSMSSASVNVPSHPVAKQESVCPRVGRNIHNKQNENSLAYRGKVIVVRGEDSVASEATENGETCATTTTFKSNIVNGKRSTNTILVRYKPSKASSAPSEDDLQVDVGNRSDSLAPVSSSSSTISSESTSSGTKDKASTSAWAQIMELEGYRSPAIGLDNLPTKRNNESVSDDESLDYSNPNNSSHNYSTDSPSNCSSIKCSDKNYYYSKSCNEEIKEDKTNDPIYVNNNFDREVEEYKVYPVMSHEPESTSVAKSDVYCSETRSNNRDSKSEVFNKSQATHSKYTSDSALTIPEHSLTTSSSVQGEQNCIKTAQKVKSPMYRSESSRASKAILEKNKSRRKTLPDGNLQFADKYQSKSAKKHLSPEHDPNASWGRYNSRAMRDSVRKVAQKYAETVYLRRQTHSRLDALPEVKDIQLTRYVSPYSSQNHVHSNSNFQNSLYCSRVPNIASHLHDIPHEPVSMISNRRKLHLLVPKSTHHDHNMLLHDYLWNCPHKKGDYKSGSFEKRTRADQVFSNLFRESHIENDSISSNSDKCSSRNSQLNSSDDSEYLCCDEVESSLPCVCNFDYSNYTDSSKCVRSKSYKSSKCKVHSTNTLKIDDSNLSLDNEEDFYFSNHMRDIKSKLCMECAQSAESGPPSKQSASRTKCSKSLPFTSNANSSSSTSASKALYSTTNNVDIPQHFHLRASKENSSCKTDSTSKRCTMLTAQEMADLVRGNKLNDYKLSHVGVTSKVTSWIQKQKDKRKPVFFIGDSPAFFSSSNKESSVHEKQINRKSKRSLSLSSVREDDVCTNSKTTAESTLNLLAVRVNPSGNDGDNDHKNLYIKRASSSCSNRGSTRRKIRQGSPVREEKVSVTKNFDDHQNQVDGCIASLNNRHNNKAQSILYLDYLTASDQNNPNYDEQITPKKISNSQDRHSSNEHAFLPSSDKKDNINATDASETNGKLESKRQNYVDRTDYFPNEYSKFSSLDDSCRNLDTLDENKPERLSFSKRLLNIKQLTRALSLHSLKKKTKESDIPLQKFKQAETTSSQFSKWTRSSKRKVDGNKYGSLRKSLSYCELTVREANISTKSKLLIKSRAEIKTASKPSARTSVSFTSSVCCCSTTLRRSVSLYGKFPLNRPLDYSWDEPKSDTLARLCFSRLYRRNGVPPFVRQMKIQKIFDKMKVSDGTTTVSEKPTHHLDSPKPERVLRAPIIVLPNFTGSEINILRKRAASTSDYSPKSKAIQRPVSVADYLTLENSCTKISNGQNDLPRTASDTTSSDEQQKNLTSLDQIWRANPVKLCRVHSRLLMCRHKGRYRLRRSISQPVELEMTGSIHNLRDSTHGSADHESFQKGSLSSDDEVSSESDIYHSYCCSPTRRSNTCWELSADGTMYAEALWDHETIDPEELPFQAGDIIEVTDTSDQDWWWGSKDGHGGWFPSAFVRLFVSHRTPSLHFNREQSEGIQIPYSPCKTSMNNLSCEQVRANIVQEIVATERDYVKHLKDVVEGYLKQVHRRPDMFSKERIETVFGNIKEIYTFQSHFLKQLEDCLVKDTPHLSQIGNCFLNHKEEFKMYSQYCNNHPLAVNELQELYCDSQYIHFFEACRLLQEMIDISLDGFLLTPIQRICKYPLQLAELLKFTDVNHPDHVPVTNALAAMKEVAELVNERKRRMECLERIAEWQNTIEGWEGLDVLDTSSILIHCGEVTRVSSSWSRDIYLFIFDHQLIYCKKDLLKRHTYAYKGRLNLDHCDIVDVEDGKDSQFAVNVKNAWKIYCKDKEKWYLFYAKTSPEKDQWLRAFKAERQRVADDEKQGFVVTEEAKKSARLAVHNKQKPKRPRAKFTKGRRCHPDVAVTELLLDSPSAKARSGSLPSNIHPELAIMAGAKLGPTRKKGSGWFHFGSGKKPKS